MPSPLIELDQVSHVFASAGRRVTAVAELSLTLGAGEVLCLVGASGSGKTTTARLIAGLLRPSAGVVRFAGCDLSQLRGEAQRRYRLAVQLIHQDPYTALNPAHTVYDILAAPLRRHRRCGDAQATAAHMRELLDWVELAPTADLLRAYPHQLSGGQRQRIAIARALTVAPALLVADEAVAMLDVSLRISLLQTLARLQQQNGLSLLFITHDLALARYVAWQGAIGVMQAGRLVELAPTPQLLAQPQHPYTRALLAAAPSPEARG